MEPETPRDGSSLRDVARLASPAGVTAPAAKREARRASADSSGVVDLEALMKSHPNWLDDALSRAKGSSASIPPGSLPALSAPVLAPPSLAPTSFDEAPVGVPKNNLALIAATFGAIVLVAGATAFAFETQSRGATHVASAAPLAPVSHVEETIPPPPPAAEVANPNPVSEAVVPAAPATANANTNAPAEAARENPAQANASEPAAADDTTPSRHGHKHGLHHAALGHAVAAAPAPVATPAAKPGKPTSALDAALRGAAGPVAVAPAPAPSPAAAPASAPAGDRPDRPSGSAVTSALTSALPAARGCLASGAEPSHARVTFGSNGGVQSVELTGPAAGDRKATSCLRAAFGHAHVPPFAQSSYSAGVTVRPQ